VYQPTIMLLCETPCGVEKEFSKFEVNHRLHVVPYAGQHKVPMMWLFSIKKDGTCKARLVVRGDQMIPYVDFDPNAVCCGNVSACSIKIVLCISTKYKLIMKEADIVGAYLVTKNNPDYKFVIHTPDGYAIGPDQVIKAVGNLYGAPPAAQNFSIEFYKCVKECGLSHSPWDSKLFFKWVNGLPLLLMAHSDDFRWFGSPTMKHEWDLLVATFNAHNYEITDASDKEFVGINISTDEDMNYYMNQTRMVEAILTEAGMKGVRDEHLPYPMSEPSLSKLDNATDEALSNMATSTTCTHIRHTWGTLEVT
jgi:Reverse transcriptase (RNA-dependent DNA polymerase)